MREYHEQVRAVLSDERSYFKQNRTGVATISKFGHYSVYDLGEGFPLLTTKRLHTRSITEELLWFLRGEDNIRSLQERGVTIWDEWADENGNLGPVYGVQWRRWPTTDGGHIDQVAQALDQIKKNPDSRRIIVSGWNVGEIGNMALPPCHLLYHFNVRGNKLDCLLYQRSCDTGLGVPFNIASVAIFTSLMAKETGLEPGVIVHEFGDLHIYCGSDKRGAFYKKHLEELKERVRSVGEDRRVYLEVKRWIDEVAPPDVTCIGNTTISGRMDHVPWLLLQLSREPRPKPRLEIAEKPLDVIIRENSDENFRIVDYNPYPGIKMDIAV